MPRNITVTFADGTAHTYQNAPDDLTPEQVTERARREFGKEVTALDGGRKGTSTTIAINGIGKVEVGPEFLSLSDDERNAAIEEIVAAHRGGQTAYPSNPEPKVSESEVVSPPEESTAPNLWTDHSVSEPTDPGYDAWLKANQITVPSAPSDGKPNKTSTSQAVGLGFGDSAALGFLDEAGAVADLLLGGPEGTQNIWSSDRKWKEIYDHNVKFNRKLLKAAEAEHGGAFLAGNVAGGFIPISRVGKLAVGASNLSRTGKLGRAAAEGAMYGGLYGLGSDEGGLKDRLDGAAKGAAIGTVAGPVAYGAIKGGEKLLRPAVRTLLPKVAEAQFAKEQASNPYLLTDASVASDVHRVYNGLLANKAKRSLSKTQQATFVKRLDELEQSYLPTDDIAALDLPPSVKTRLKSALVKRHLLSNEEIAALRDGTPAGEAVADGIEKARRLRSYVPETPDSGSNRAGAALAEAIGSAAGWKAAGPVGGALGGRIGRAAVSRSEVQSAKAATALAKLSPSFEKLPEVAAQRGTESPASTLGSLADRLRDAGYVSKETKQKLEADARKVATANARDDIRPSGGYRGLIYERTGLLPSQQDAGVLAALNEGALTPEQFDAYLDEPAKLMTGNAGNALIDRLAAMAESGKLKRDPEWKPSTAIGRAAIIEEAQRAADEADVAWRSAQDADSAAFEATGMGSNERPTAQAVRETYSQREAALERLEQLKSETAPETIRNPLAYAATANGNQQRITEALSAIRSRDGLQDADREILATAIAAIGNTSKKSKAQEVATDTLDRLPAEWRDYAGSILSPLVEQIRK